MPRLSEVRVGQAIPGRSHTPTNVSLFLYNAAIWNPHRIHYDEKYTTEVERHPGVVIDGPLQGDWLAQVVTNWLGGREVDLRTLEDLSRYFREDVLKAAEVQYAQE